MTSIFSRAMGSGFDRLHPKLQERFGFESTDEIACIGRGVMTHVGRGAWWTVPFLRFGTWRNILFPENARNIPFVIENYAYRDNFGRETVTFVRTFQMTTARRRRFDATMIYDRDRGRVIDYLGTHQHLAVDLDLKVTDDGSLELRSGAQRFYEGPVGFTFPAALTGQALLREGYDDAKGCFTIDVRVTNRWFGPLFSYQGEFQCDYPAVDADHVPAAVRPLREERRT